MTSTGQRHTAKIYQFPRRPEFSAARIGSDVVALGDANKRRPPGVDSESGWYHERAIAEEHAARKP